MSELDDILNRHRSRQWGDQVDDPENDIAKQKIKDLVQAALDTAYDRAIDRLPVESDQTSMDVYNDELEKVVREL